MTVRVLSCIFILSELYSILLVFYLREICLIVGAEDVTEGVFPRLLEISGAIRVWLCKFCVRLIFSIQASALVIGLGVRLLAMDAMLFEASVTAAGFPLKLHEENRVDVTNDVSVAMQSSDNDGSTLVQQGSKRDSGKVDEEGFLRVEGKKKHGAHKENKGHIGASSSMGGVLEVDVDSEKEDPLGKMGDPKGDKRIVEDFTEVICTCACKGTNTCTSACNAQTLSMDMCKGDPMGSGVSNVSTWVEKSGVEVTEGMRPAAAPILDNDGAEKVVLGAGGKGVSKGPGSSQRQGTKDHRPSTPFKPKNLMGGEVVKPGIGVKPIRGILKNPTRPSAEALNRFKVLGNEAMQGVTDEGGNNSVVGIVMEDLGNQSNISS
ncbi:hypothetical protein L6452_09322 [Arctium lappa]|uniref:Uncharacterized protein n=1 Tax=Arctium lappa TaxID=4217 RepID=A0ACB9DK20_ARCLA|nr:hypothetical protein L6452_09322 [Arctium lappa]